MTPLAAHLAKQLTVPKKKCHPFWLPNRERLQENLSGIHCFEVSEALAFIPDLSKILTDRFGAITRDEDVPAEQTEFVGGLVFLPAPKTWIEYRHPLTWRIGILLEEFGNVARASLFTEESAGNLGSLSLVSDDWKTTEGICPVPNALAEGFNAANQDHSAFFRSFLTLSHCMLILINSPQIIGRKQHMPHVGLEKRLRKAGVGKFPLHAWTEIKLHVAKPIEIDDGEPHEAHLTGRRALHFVRKHIRIRLGKLEYVSAHWRGDPAIGLKRSRYQVTA